MAAGAQSGRRALRSHARQRLWACFRPDASDASGARLRGKSCRKAFYYIPLHAQQQAPLVNTVHCSATRGATLTLVADTQVVLDWLVFRDAAAVPLLEAVIAGQLRWLTTPTMRTELQHMLRHSSLAHWGHDIERALTFYDRQSDLQPDPVAPVTPFLVCSDPDDQIFIDTALVHRATWLATRDRALIKLRRKALGHGLHIVQPVEWRHTHTPA